MGASKKAVVLSSGGLDSTTVMAIAKSEGYEIYSLSFRYGQRHSQELVISIDIRKIGRSALTDEKSVPKDRTTKDMEKDIPVTYVPARNTIFLSLALSWAEILEADTIFGIVKSV